MRRGDVARDARQACRPERSNSTREADRLRSPLHTPPRPRREFLRSPQPLLLSARLIAFEHMGSALW
jgi:hypothetical protein